jgi:hypothetical protein
MGLDMEIRVNGIDLIYMRKANAIRKWFADHLENFEDNGETEITKTNFENIIADMKRVIVEGGVEDLFNKYAEFMDRENEDDAETRDDWQNILLSWDLFVGSGEPHEKFAKVANEIFPSSSGFFFGGTDYDRWYINDLFTFYIKFTELNDYVNWDTDMVTYWEWY